MSRLGSPALLIGLLAMAAPLAALAQTVDPVRPDDRTVGASDAPVTLTVYQSMTCGHCAQWRLNHYPAIKAKYVDSGQVRVVYRDLPTQPQALAVAGAAMARCAPVERYEAVLDTLFKGQATHFPHGRLREWLVAGGTAGGLTEPQMQACLSAGNVAAVEARGARSIADGVTSTPRFFVDGRPVLEQSASHDVAAFDAVLQPLLGER